MPEALLFPPSIRILASGRRCKDGGEVHYIGGFFLDLPLEGGFLALFICAYEHRLTYLRDHEINNPKQSLYRGFNIFLYPLFAFNLSASCCPGFVAALLFYWSQNLR